MYGMLNIFIYMYLICIYLYLPLTSINKLRCAEAVNFITLPPGLSKSLVNENNCLNNVNILNFFNIISNN